MKRNKVEQKYIRNTLIIVVVMVFIGYNSTVLRRSECQNYNQLMEQGYES